MFLGFWVLEQLFWAVATVGIPVGIAFGAHLGGFAFGLLVGVALKIGLFRRRDLEE